LTLRIGEPLASSGVSLLLKGACIHCRRTNQPGLDSHGDMLAEHLIGSIRARIERQGNTRPAPEQAGEMVG
jgi:hypothetical protein